MAEEKEELKELKERMSRIELVLEQIAERTQKPPQPPIPQATTGVAPWEELIKRPRPPHPDPYHVPPDVLLARGQQWIYNELVQIRSLLEEILMEVKK